MTRDLVERVTERPVGYRAPTSNSSPAEDSATEGTLPSWTSRNGAFGTNGAASAACVALMREWDPIGVSGIREARDEYDSYIGMIADQLRSGSTADVAAKLGYIRSEWMGTPTDPTADVRIAELLRSWYEQEMDRWTASKGVR